MKEFNYIIQDELGIHARPAGMLAKEAIKFQSTIKIKKGDAEADAKRILGLMRLGVKKGENITVSVDGADEAEAVSAMEEFLKKNL